MREVIYIDKEKKEREKPIELTHELCVDYGWVMGRYKPLSSDKVIYLGRCVDDGDMFAVIESSYITIHKGHLNSGKY